MLPRQQTPTSLEESNEKAEKANVREREKAKLWSTFKISKKKEFALECNPTEKPFHRIRS
jgi:hypothetical protein